MINTCEVSDSVYITSAACKVHIIVLLFTLSSMTAPVERLKLDESGQPSLEVKLVIPMDERTDSGLCCCEYVNQHGESSHILAVCCNCEELDAACDSIIKGETVADERVSLVSDEVLDRLRIPNPFGGGAKRLDQLVDITIFPPMVFLPFGIFVAALGPVMTLIVCFVIAPVSIYWYYNKILKHRRRTQFFLSWALTSFSSMYALMMWVVYPEEVISPPEFAAMTMLFLCFHVTFFRTKLGAHPVSPKLTDSNQSSRQQPSFRKRNHINQVSRPQEPAPNYCQDQNQTVTIMEGSRTSSNEDWCQTCQAARPPRAGHCRICSACYYRLDHHCMWLDCCIGSRNHRSFILCLLLFIVGCLWGSLRVIVILFGDEEDDFLPMCLEVYASRMRAIVFVSSLYVLGSGIAVTSLLLHQIWLISHNWTFRERRLARITNSEAQLAAMNQGFFQNWIYFLFGNLD